MSEFFVVDAKCGVTEGGMACGPCSGHVVTAVAYRKDDEPVKWFINIEVDGLMNSYITEEDVFDRLITEDELNDEVFGDFISESFVDEFDGISLDGDYREIYEQFSESDNEGAKALLRYIITLTRCDLDDVDSIIALAKGKVITEIDLPGNDIEDEIAEEEFWEEDE